MIVDIVDGVIKSVIFK